MIRKERIQELKDTIRDAEKEKHRLEKELNEELLPKYVGKYFKNKDGSEFYKICKYDEDNKNLGCWSFGIANDWNNHNYYETEYLLITHYYSLQNKVEINEEEYLSEMNKFLDSIRQSLVVGG